MIRADARSIPLRDGCVQTVVTSPPYWNLRNYNVTGQIGMEATIGEYVSTLVSVFREVRRVLRDDGTVWCNLGDSYFGSSQGWGDTKTTNKNHNGSRERNKPEWSDELKPKDLCMMPARVALALQADGWWLRSDIIWAKPNPMPESVTDRPTRSHEYIFLLAKSDRYFYDDAAIREPSEMRPQNRFTNGRGEKDCGYADHRKAPGMTAPAARNKRDVWTINSEPTPEAHFATFPQKLVEPCILAGSSEKGCCAQCGAPRVRVTDVDYIVQSPIAATDKAHDPAQGNNFATRALGRASKVSTTTGWRPSCSHDAPSIPCLVLDPFGGSGTTGVVAERFGRRWVALDLSEPYLQIARRRTAQMGLGL